MDVCGWDPIRTVKKRGGGVLLLSLIVRAQSSNPALPNVQRVCECVCVCVCEHSTLTVDVWLLLEDIVDQDLKEDEEKDDDPVALL